MSHLHVSSVRTENGLDALTMGYGWVVWESAVSLRPPRLTWAAL